MFPPLPWNQRKTGAPSLGTHQPWSWTPSAAVEPDLLIGQAIIRGRADERGVGKVDNPFLRKFQDHAQSFYLYHKDTVGTENHKDERIENFLF